MHLAIDHHLHRRRRDADKADHRQQAGKQAFDAVDPPQLNTDQKHGADIEEVERGVVKRAGDRLQRRKKGERGKAGEPILRIQHHIGDQYRKGPDDDHRHQSNKRRFDRHNVAIAVECRRETPQRVDQFVL